jgi:hypothetical protein
VAGKTSPTGYTLELAIPFTSLTGATVERLKQPIGFDLMVDDVDSLSNGQTTSRINYSWGDSGNNWADASIFGIADPAYKSPLPEKYIRVIPGHLLEAAKIVNGHRVIERRIEAGVITVWKEGPQPSLFSYDCSQLRPDGSEKEVDLIGIASNGATASGFAVECEDRFLPRLSPGAYIVRTNYTELHKTLATRFSIEAVVHADPKAKKGAFVPGTRAADQILAGGKVVLPK